MLLLLRPVILAINLSYLLYYGKISNHYLSCHNWMFNGVFIVSFNVQLAHGVDPIIGKYVKVKSWHYYLLHSQPVITSIKSFMRGDIFIIYIYAWIRLQHAFPISSWGIEGKGKGLQIDVMQCRKWNDVNGFIVFRNSFTREVYRRSYCLQCHLVEEYK